MKYLIILITVMIIASCSKAFLNKKVSSEYELADDLDRLANLLKNDDLMAQTPVLGEQSADNYYLNEDFYNQLNVQDQNIYLWKKDVWEGKTDVADWTLLYRQVLACNLVLESLNKITPSVAYEQKWNEVKGTALFMRAYTFYNLSQVFAKGYDSATADQALGVAMPLEANTEIVPPRSSIKETYAQTIGDLLIALPLVSQEVPSLTRNTANKPAVFALLARIHLSMRKYALAKTYADSSLRYYNKLINFNSLNLSAKYPIAANNDETLYQSWMSSVSNVIQGKVIPGAVIDSVLYSSYETNDLRKKVYFAMGPYGPYFNTSYTGKSMAFSGLSVGENLLIKAECNARENNVETALSDLNELLASRYKTGSAPVYKNLSKEEALDIILKERRKETIFRGLRWSDLQRLNKEEASVKIVPKRLIKGQSYQLLPMSSNYALPLPDDALREHIILQNERE